MVNNAYKAQFYGVVVTLLLCSVTYRVAAIAALVGIIGTIFGLLCIAAVSSFPEMDYPRVVRRLHCDTPVDLKAESSSWKNSEFAINHPDVVKEFEDISELLIRDFITSWFQRIDAEGASGFQQTVKNTILGSVAKLDVLLERVDATGLLILKLMPLFTKHFEAFRSAREAVQDDKSLPTTIQNTELQLVVEYNKQRKLHHCLSLRPSSLHRDVEVYMTAKTEKLMPLLIDERELSSPFVSTLLRDILATCVLKPLVMKLSDSDFWNLTLISISDKVLEEQDQVSQVRRFLSREVEVQNNDQGNEVNLNSVTHVEQELRPGMTGAQFELYLRQISQLTSIENLQKERFLVIAKLLSLRNNKSPLKSSNYEKRLLLSLNLLQTRLRSVDPRGSSAKHHQHPMNLTDAMKNVDEFEDFLQTVKLIDILQEPKCLIYFEKFLTMKLYRRGICYLNFWKMTESMRNPLEDAHEDIIVTISPWEITQLKETASNFFKNEQLDFMRILDPGLVTNILLFIKDSGGNASRTFPLARRSILLLQSEAQRALNVGFFEEFKMSNIFLDMLASGDFAGTELYARIAAGSQSREASSTARTRDCLSTIRVFSNPGIDNAIENILNRNPSERRRSYSQAQHHDTRDRPLEVSDIKPYNDTLFEDEDEDEDANSVRHHNMADDDISDSETSVNELNGHSLAKFTDLKDKIAQLTVSVDQIEKQLELLGHLILKAELTNNQKQLKLLRKSQRALIGDVDNKELLKQQLIVCQNANSLYRKTKVAIKSYFVDTSRKDEGGVIYYLISVEHINNGQVATWAVPRRFSEFYRLHSYMKVKYKNSLKNLNHKESFPKKVKLSLSLNTTRTLLCRERKVKLERYIRDLLRVPEICQDDLLRKFLTDSTTFSESSIATALIKSKESRESSSAEGSLYSSASENGLVRPSASSVPLGLEVSDENDEEFSFLEDGRSSIGSNEQSDQDRPFLKEICDTFISVFLLNKSNSGWLRGRAIVTVLQQLMGNAIERYIMDAMTKLTSESRICGILAALKDKLWENNATQSRRSKTQRLPGEIQKTKTESQLLFKCLFIEVCGKVVGLKNAQEAASQLHEMVQNSYLTTSLMLDIFDTICEELTASSKHINYDARASKPSPVETRNPN